MATQWFAYPLDDQANSILCEGLREAGQTVATQLVRDKSGSQYTAILIPGDFVKLIRNNRILRKACWILYRNTAYGKVYHWTFPKKISAKAKEMKEKVEQLKKKNKP